MKYYCYGNYSADKYVRNCQLVYLYYEEGLTRGEVANIVGLAPTTVSKYARECEHLIDIAKEMFTNKPSKKEYDFGRDYSNRIFADSKDTNKFYLLRITNLMTKKLIVSKIGTTTRPINARVSEIEKDYRAKYNQPIYIEIKRVYDCGKMTPILFESLFRAEYISLYTNNFIENDRFEEIDFDYDKADKMYEIINEKIEKKIALVQRAIFVLIICAKYTKIT